MKHGKKYVDGAKLVERSRLYDTEEALDLCIKTGTAKFDETVEVHVKLGVDGRHADQQVRGAIVLPHGTGKSVRVLAICKPEKEEEARNAGADFVGGNDMIQKIQSEGWMDFDVVVTTPDMMGMVGRLGKVLGPRGLMPNLKAGTVTLTSPVPSRKRRPVRSSTASTRRISSTARSARFPSARRSCSSTSIRCSKPSTRRSRLLRRASISAPASLRRRWAPASRSTRIRSADPESEKGLDRLSLSCYNN